MTRHVTLPILSLCLSLIATGCAGPEISSNPSFSSVAAAPTPRLKFHWRTQLHEPLNWAYLPQEYSRPALTKRTDDLVVGSSDGWVSRLRAGSGEPIWQHRMADDQDESSPVHADILVTQDVVFAATLAGTVEGLDIGTGETLWRYQAEDAVEGALAYEGDRLFFMDAREILYALDANTGELLWRYQRRTPEYFTIKGAGAPVVDGDVVYCGFADGNLAALQIDSGELVWITDLGNDEGEFTDVDAPVVVDEEVIYAASYSGGLYALSRYEGLVQWRAPISEIASFVKRGRMLYVASTQGKVMALDLDTRQMTWSFKLREHVPVALTAHGPYVFVSTSSGPLIVLDEVSGVMLLRWNPSQGFNTPLVFDQQRGYALSNGGYLYGFDLAF